MGVNEQDLLKIVRQDNNAVINKMQKATDNPACDIRHSPLADGIARSIRVQELVLEHVMITKISASNGAANERAERDEQLVFGMLKVGTLRAAGLPAIILAAFIGYAIVNYYHTQSVATEVKTVAVAEASNVAAKVIRAERRQVNRDDVRTTLLELIRETQEKEAHTP
jgi:hypothetical protein